MSYTALDILQAMGTAHATAQMVVKASDQSYAIYIEDGHITNVHGCPIAELFQRLNVVDPHVEIFPLHASITQPIRTKITSFALEQAHLLDQNSQTRPIPTEAAFSAGHGIEVLESQGKLDNRTKRTTAQNIRIPGEYGSAVETLQKELVFHRGHSYEVTIGRAAECDFVSLHPSVSRQHCLIQFDGERFQVRDLGSKNGTRLNGTFITEAEADVEDVLILGSEVFLLGADTAELGQIAAGS